MSLAGKLSVIALVAAVWSPLAVLAAGADDANKAVLAAKDGRYDEAIQLFTSAINSDELTLKGRAQAYAYRGIARAMMGDYEGGQLDLNSSVALDSDYNADAYAFRGYMRLVLGQSKEAASDLEKSAEIKVWAYNVLWLHVARLKAGLPDEGSYSLANNVVKLEATPNQDGTSGLSRWPAALVKFMQGTGTRESVAAAAQEGDPARLNERVCDVYFYLGELDLAHNDSAAAKPQFERASQTCPFASFERMGAAAELKRLN
jgi:lipoprotein NlpI